jgi:hypothetical protein
MATQCCHSGDVRIVAPLLTALRIAWPVLIGVVIFAAFGRYGFNPTDEGFVNGVAYRVLQGEIPHRDFIWARPVGSAYLHAAELLLPSPGLMTSRAIALAEIIGYSVLLAALAIRRWHWEWGLAEVGIVVVSILVNLNTMPLMAWPTIDGALLVAGGAVVLQAGLDRDRPRLVFAAFVFLGAAMTMKQSFWPAPFFGMMWVLLVSGHGVLPRRVITALLGTVLIPGLYVAGVAVADGLDEMLVQLGSAKAVIGIELITLVRDPLRTAGLCTLVGVGAWLAPHPKTPAVLRAAIPAVVALAVAAIVATMGLDLVGEWAIMLWWLVVTATAVRSIRNRHADWAGLALIALGWMVSLSYGLASPALVGGSLGAFLVLRCIQDVESEATDDSMARAGRVVAATLLVLICTPTFVSERRTEIYRDRPAVELTASLDAVDDDFAGVVTNPITASYLEQLVECVHDHPADEVAVLPDNPAIYPYLELSNPFPADWIIPLDIIGSEGRFVEAAAALDDRGGYLVLFQPVQASLLGKLENLDPSPDGPFRDRQLGEAIRNELTGQSIRCGPFDGVWAP